MKRSSVSRQPTPMKPVKFRRCEICLARFEGKFCTAEHHSDDHPITSIYLEPKMEKAA